VRDFHGFLNNSKALAESTGFTRYQIFSFWVQYKSLCMLSSSPKGVDMEAFRRFVPTVSMEDSTYASRMFTVLDRTGTGNISWMDFLGAMASIGDDPKRKASFLFEVYDLKGSGELSKEELFEFFAASLNITVPPDFDLEVYKTKCMLGVDPDQSPLELMKDNDALLLCCALFSENTFLQLDIRRTGKVTLASALEFIMEGGQDKQDVGKLFGRSMLSSLEADTTRIMTGAHESRLEAKVAVKRMNALASKVLIDELRSLNKKL